MMANPLDLKNVNVYLIGMIGVDKGPTGQLLSKELGYRFLETDTLISQLAETSMEELRESQEQELRVLESQVLAQVSAYTRLVVATGDGIVLERANWSHLQQGLVVWLDLPVSLLWDRLQSEAYAAAKLSLQTLEQQMQDRRSLYAQADVHLLIKPEWTPSDVVDQIYAGLGKVIKTDV